jgi:hypothetical protein
VHLENEAFAVQELEDCRREEEIPRGSRRIRRRFIAASVSATPKSQPRVEKVEGEAFLGIKTHWVLFRKFFRVKP